MVDEIDVRYLKKVREKATTEVSGPYKPGALLDNP